jgi:E-phenylitaconyl-CoA hydratase
MTNAHEVPVAAEEILYERDGHLARITLNRPGRANAMSSAMRVRIKEIWGEVRDEPEIRCAIVTAAGTRHFSTGLDVSEVVAAGGIANNRPLTDAVFWSPRQNRVWKPVICAVNGLVAGGGLHFVVDADIVVAVDTASFVDTHVNVGMVGAIENIGLAKRLPIGTALRMTLQGKNFRLTARRAYELGFVDELVAPADLMRTAEQIAADIVKNSPKAVSLSQQAIWNSQEAGYQQSMEYGWALARMHWAHPDFTEGTRAFAEGREPRWASS